MPMMIETAPVLAAIANYGAVEVRRAAFACMSGDTSRLRRMGLLQHLAGFGDVWRLTNTCFERMRESERTTDYAQTKVALAKAIGAEKDMI